ncbi:MAG TPA: molybdenum cofactor guanylyltransferase MobA [Devosiaceae bacterium]|nr:molybdenum cofactor guanylyltransferase MobA [Devosiaceae bacterium]
MEMPAEEVVGVVLAGGQSRRMGRDKGMLTFGRETLVERAARRLAGQVGRVIISANGDRARYEPLGLPIVPDAIADCGPLGGLHAALTWTANAGLSHVLTVACDTPFFPLDLAPRLASAMLEGDAEIGIARSGGRDHYAFLLHPVRLRFALEQHLAGSENRSIRGWLAQHRTAFVEFEGEPDPFFNVNTPADLATLAERG